MTTGLHVTRSGRTSSGTRTGLVRASGRGTSAATGPCITRSVDVPDMDAVMAAMATQEAADAMEYDGVLPETLVILVES
jgi:hypothetical protein